MPNELTPQELTEQLYKRNLELYYERSRVEKLLYSVSEAVIAIDENHQVTLFNRVAEVMTGMKKEHAVGKELKDILKLETEKEELIDLYEHTFDAEKDTLNSLVYKGTFRNYYVNYKSFTVARQDGTKECLITLSDITHEKELEKSKDDFLYVASHELRTPMTIIKSYVWMLKTGKPGPLNEKQMNYLEKAANGTERMIGLINDMLNISRFEQGRLQFDIQKVNVCEAVEDALTGFELKTAEKNIYLDIDNHCVAAPVYFDSNKLKEIVTNFVGNSIKFTKTGGISVRVIDGPEYVRVQVTDTGTGIRPEDMSKLFLKFGRLDFSYQTVAENGGTGLGLYICKMYAEAMGGRVGVHSDGPGTGATFWVDLPKKEGAISTIGQNDLKPTPAVAPKTQEKLTPSPNS
jgi:two-component system sensor histidine kinase VicK